jgi:hypothetical protein
MGLGVDRGTAAAFMFVVSQHSKFEENLKYQLNDRMNAPLA